MLQTDLCLQHFGSVWSLAWLHAVCPAKLESFPFLNLLVQGRAGKRDKKQLRGQRWMEAAPVGFAAPNVFTACNLWEENLLKYFWQTDKICLFQAI